MKQLPLSLLLLTGLSLASCSGSTEPSDTATVEHNVSEEQLEGEWYYKSVTADIDINIPGMQDYFKQILLQQLQKASEGTHLIYKSDYTVSFVNQSDTLKGHYKIEHNELVHSGFNTKEPIINYANARLEGTALKLSVSEEQFMKMLHAADSTMEIPEEVRNIIKVSGLTYTFEKK